MVGTSTAPETQPRFRAFISYSHRDAAIAGWLHRSLEGYRIPKHLIGSETLFGPVLARLTPIFRDREDLPAATDLSAAVKAALAVSDSLIVICSPAAAASPWVTREIETFHALHPDRPVLLAIADGEPADCFPPAIRALAAEPLAADLRKSGDGRRLGLLKLVAGITGLPLDRLAQRDTQRRQRRVMAVTLAALAGLILMSVLLALAVLARSESERQRQQAEGLVEYMLTDLRDRLKGVGRLDVMTAVNERAMAYYGAQGDLESLPPESLERRARILHAMGEDDEKRGNTALALAKFTEASRTTAALLAASPGDPERIYGHAQSEYWVGEVAFHARDIATAKAHFKSYKRLADRLVQSDPNNPRWLKEEGFATGNLCTLALRRPVAVDDALDACSASLRWMAKATRHDPSDAESAESMPNRHAWLADALQAAGRSREALGHRREQLRMAVAFSAATPDDAGLLELVARAQIGLAQGLVDQGDARDLSTAHDAVRAAWVIIDRLEAIDPADRSRTRLKDKLRAVQGRISEGERQ